MRLSKLTTTAPLLTALLGAGVARAGGPSAAKLSKRCNKGDSLACVEIAQRWAEAPERACHAGVASACLVLADTQLEGLGVTDGERARRAYRQACSLGIREACSRMAVVEIFEQDPDQSPSPLTLVVQTSGLTLTGITAAMLSARGSWGGNLHLPCARDEPCTGASDFDWRGLTQALEQVKDAAPSRTQIMLRLGDEVRFDAAFEAILRLRGGDMALAGTDRPLFPSVTLVEEGP